MRPAIGLAQVVDALAQPALIQAKTPNICAARAIPTVNRSMSYYSTAQELIS